MISLPAIQLILRHLDSVDACVSKRLMRKRPWSETALTSLLCDLLDQDDQSDERLAYSIDELNRDLKVKDGVLSVVFEVTTHEYGSHLERWVTQADLGLVVSYRDYITPSASYEKSWLLQAKRAFPIGRGRAEYSEGSAFESMDDAQHQRMAALSAVVGTDFVRYLLYCPRPEYVDPARRARLRHIRNRAVSGNIFDYSLGLQLREDLLSESPTVDAGLLVAPMEPKPTSVGQALEHLFKGTLPLSWFLLQHFADRNRFLPPGSRPSGPSSGTADQDELARGIVTGDREAIEQVLEATNGPEHFEAPFVPAHTIRVEITAGSGQEHDQIQPRRLR